MKRASLMKADRLSGAWWLSSTCNSFTATGLPAGSSAVRSAVVANQTLPNAPAPSSFLNSKSNSWDLSSRGMREISTPLTRKKNTNEKNEIFILDLFPFCIWIKNHKRNGKKPQKTTKNHKKMGRKIQKNEKNQKKWTKNHKKMGKKFTKNHKKWTKNGEKMDKKPQENGEKMKYFILINFLISILRPEIFPY